jgi:hypothetical protein
MDACEKQSNQIAVSGTRFPNQTSLLACARLLQRRIVGSDKWALGFSTDLELPFLYIHTDFTRIELFFTGNIETEKKNLYSKESPTKLKSMEKVYLTP